MAGCNGGGSQTTGVPGSLSAQPADMREGLANAYNVVTAVSTKALSRRIDATVDCCRVLGTQRGTCTRQLLTSMMSEVSVLQWVEYSDTSREQ